ncbi:20997_t:CDS:2, partial [Racocetra persica]
MAVKNCIQKFLADNELIPRINICCEPYGFEEVLDNQIKTSLDENFEIVFNEKIFE